MISGYLCPVCKSRLTFMKYPAKDLFCPRCYTVVALIDEQACIYTPHGEGKSLPCTLEQLRTA